MQQTHGPRTVSLSLSLCLSLSLSLALSLSLSLSLSLPVMCMCCCECLHLLNTFSGVRRHPPQSSQPRSPILDVTDSHETVPL